jgi:hypothetical protein
VTLDDDGSSQPPLRGDASTSRQRHRRGRGVRDWCRRPQPPLHGDANLIPGMWGRWADLKMEVTDVGGATGE